MIELSKIKILVVSSESMFCNSQTSITQRNIFRRCQCENILEIYTGANGVKPEKMKNILQYKIPENRLPLLRVSRLKLFRKANSDAKIKSVTSVNNTDVSKKAKLIADFRQWLVTLVDRTPLNLKKCDYKVVEEFNPTVIYTMGSSVLTMKLAAKLSKRTGVPIIPHFMDNWPECIQWQDNKLVKGYRKSLDSWLRKVYSLSKCALTISQEMATDYELKTAIKHFALYNAINIDLFRCNQKPKDIFVFTYAGGLHLGRDKMLVEFAKALDQVSKDISVKIKLEIYTNSDVNYISGVLDGYDNVTINKAVAHDEIKHIYEKSSALLFVESLQENSVEFNFTKYSISTKTAEYLASGIPIFYVGAETKALTQYFIENNAAFVVTSLENLTTKIKEFIYKRSYNDLTENAYLLCLNNHNEKNINKYLELVIDYSLNN